MKKKKGVRTNIVLTEEQYRTLRVWGAKNDWTMQAIFSAAIDLWIAENIDEKERDASK
jgi:hypothetical protein